MLFRSVLGAEPPSVDDDDSEEVSDQLGGSYAEKLGKRDFSDLTPDEIAQVRAMIARMIWKPADAWIDTLVQSDVGRHSVSRTWHRLSRS